MNHTATTPGPEPTLSIVQVAKKVGRSQGLIRKIVSSGELRSVKIGEHRYVPESALVEYWESGSSDVA